MMVEIPEDNPERVVVELLINPALTHPFYMTLVNREMSSSLKQRIKMVYKRQGSKGCCSLLLTPFANTGVHCVCLFVKA